MTAPCPCSSLRTGFGVIATPPGLDVVVVVIYFSQPWLLTMATEQSMELA
jgi:hypothetical protein